MEDRSFVKGLQNFERVKILRVVGTSTIKSKAHIMFLNPNTRHP